MNIEAWIQYGAIAVAILLLAIIRKDIKKYIPVGLFVSYYAHLWCNISFVHHWWDYPSRLVPQVAMSVISNEIVMPIMAMFIIRYFPSKLKDQIILVIFLSGIFTAIEYYFERFTDLIKYHNGYDWYYTYILWVSSLFIWHRFHLWVHIKKGK